MLFCKILEPRRMHLKRRIIYEHVQSAEFAEGLRHSRATETPITDIARDQQTATSLFFDRGLDRLGVDMLSQIDDRDIRSLAREQHRYGPPDAGVAACHDRHFIL